MKKYIFLSIMSVMSILANGQTNSNGAAQNTIAGENVFLDVSHFSADLDRGKGLAFPTVDLTKFEFKLDGAASGWTGYVSTYFDGMVVYNSATGSTKTIATRGGGCPSAPVAVKPGFYYFYNPTGETVFNNTGDPYAAVAAGTWKPLGSGGGTDIRVSNDTLYVGCCDTITFIPPNDSLFIDIKGIYPIMSNIGEKDTVVLRLINGVEGVNNGDILMYNGTTGKWEAKPNALKADEYIWLPAINLPWKLSEREIMTVNLFKIYQQAFAPELEEGGMPTVSGGFEPTQYSWTGSDGNYRSSTGGYRSLGRSSDRAEMFDYVVTYFDRNVIKIVDMYQDGTLMYKNANDGEFPPSNAFINVLMIRK